MIRVRLLPGGVLGHERRRGIQVEIGGDHRQPVAQHPEGPAGEVPAGHLAGVEVVAVPVQLEVGGGIVPRLGQESRDGLVRPDRARKIALVHLAEDDVGDIVGENGAPEPVPEAEQGVDVDGRAPFVLVVVHGVRDDIEVGGFRKAGTEVHAHAVPALGEVGARQDHVRAPPQGHVHALGQADALVVGIAAGRDQEAGLALALEDRHLHPGQVEDGHSEHPEHAAVERGRLVLDDLGVAAGEQPVGVVVLAGGDLAVPEHVDVRTGLLAFLRPDVDVVVGHAPGADEPAGFRPDVELEGIAGDLLGAAAELDAALALDAAGVGVVLQAVGAHLEIAVEDDHVAAHAEDPLFRRLLARADDDLVPFIRDHGLHQGGLRRLPGRFQPSSRPRPAPGPPTAPGSGTPTPSCAIPRQREPGRSRRPTMDRRRRILRTCASLTHPDRSTIKTGGRLSNRNGPAPVRSAGHPRPPAAEIAADFRPGEKKRQLFVGPDDK